MRERFTPRERDEPRELTKSEAEDLVKEVYTDYKEKQLREKN
jgi:hypothetical protein